VKILGSDLISKECGRCHKKQKISGSFYTHRDFKESQYSDLWCKKCVKSFVQDKETLMGYCDANYREFSEELWEWANRFTLEKLEQDERYTSLNTIEKQDMLTKRILNEYFRSMGKTQYYRFKVDNNNNINQSQIETINQLNDPEKKIYSKKWRGHYTQQDLDYLEDYYAGLQRDFKIDNKNHEDYAMKTAKTSLMAEKAYEDWINGKGSEKAYRDAQGAFDTVSQSAKFSEKTRSYTDNNGMGSLGEITKRLEIDGFLQKKIKFEKDDVDSIIEDFRWILASIGVDTSGEQN
jgi:hypothetical protein